jgi:hypothetical protein
VVLAAAEDREEPEQVEQEGEHRAGIVSGSALRDQPLAAGWLLAKDRRSRSRWSRRVIIESGLCPDQDR